MENNAPRENELPKLSRKALITVGAVVALVFVTMFLVSWLRQRADQRRLKDAAEAAQSAMPIVEVVRPRPQDHSIVLALPGDARAKQQTALYGQVNGYLKRWWVDIGDHVEKGEVLAEISAPQVDANLDQALASLDQAKANLVKTTADADLATATFNRYQGLIPSGGVTQQQLDEKQSAMNDANAARVDAQARIKASQASIEQLRAQQNFEQIVAPFDGVITARNVDVGALISASDTAPGHELFDLAQIDELRIYVNLPQPYVGLVQPMQLVSFVVERNYPGREFAGHVARTTGAIDAQTRTMRIECDFPNDHELLTAGMYGEVRINLRQDKPALSVPTSAMMFEADGTSVAVINPNEVKPAPDDGNGPGLQAPLHFKKVVIGRDMGTELEIVAGLNDDDYVVSNPGEMIADGMAVRFGAPPPPLPVPPPDQRAASSRPVTQPSGAAEVR